MPLSISQVWSDISCLYFVYVQWVTAPRHWNKGWWPSLAKPYDGRGEWKFCWNVEIDYCFPCATIWSFNSMDELSKDDICENQPKNEYSNRPLADSWIQLAWSNFANIGKQKQMFSSTSFKLAGHNLGDHICLVWVFFFLLFTLWGVEMY